MWAINRQPGRILNLLRIPLASPQKYGSNPRKHRVPPRIAVSSLVGAWATLWKMMEWKSVGMMTFPINRKIKVMFQTTNEIFWLDCLVLLILKTKHMSCTCHVTYHPPQPKPHLPPTLLVKPVQVFKVAETDQRCNAWHLCPAHQTPDLPGVSSRTIGYYKTITEQRAAEKNSTARFDVDTVYHCTLRETT